jgi:hypothetical protein
MQFVDNGMFALSMNDPIDVDLDDDDNEVIGATSAKGMPLIRKETAEELSLRSGSPPWQDEEGGENIDINTGSPDDVVNIDEVDDLDVDGGEKDAFGHAIDAFSHVIAPEGYCYMGKLVFICFGPTLKYFAGTLAIGGQSDRTAEVKKQGSRKEQRKVNTDRNNMDREVGFDRGLSIQSKMQCAMMAQNEDDADQRYRDMCMLILTKQIESTERLLELKLKTSARMSSVGSEAQVNFTINLLMEKLEGYHGVLETMMEETRTPNPIVCNVLSMAATAMGLAKGPTAMGLAKGATAMGFKKGDEDNIEKNSADFVSDMLPIEEMIKLSSVCLSVCPSVRLCVRNSYLRSYLRKSATNQWASSSRPHNTNTQDEPLPPYPQRLRPPSPWKHLPWTRIVSPRIPMSLLQVPVARAWARCGRNP